MKSTIKTVFAAVAAMFAAIAAWADSADILEIRPCESTYPYADISTFPINTPEEPYTSGQEIYFKLRLINTTSDNVNGISWVISDDTNKVAWATNPLRVGLFARGTVDYADYVYHSEVTNALGNALFTDFVFKYTTKMGDFALPLVLAGTATDGTPVPGDFKSSFNTLYLDPSSKFKIVAANDSTRVAVLKLATVSDTTPFENDVWTSTEATNRRSDVTMKECGINIKTVNFDSHGDSDTIWRTVQQGSSYITSAYAPTLELLSGKGTNTTLSTFYVWSADESQVFVSGVTSVSDGTTTSVDTTLVYTNSTDQAPFHIAKITIPAGVGVSDSFTLTAPPGATVGATTELLLSAWPGYQIKAGGTIITNFYDTVTVAVTNPPIPTVKVSFSNTKVDASQTLEEDGSYKATLTAMTVTVEPAYHTDVDVSLTAGYADGGDTLPAGVTDFGSYIRFVDSSAFNNDAGDGVLSYAGLGYQFASLTIPAGGSVVKQVIVLRSDNTVSATGHGLKMTPALVDTSLTDIQVGAAASLRITASSPTLGSLYVGGEEISLSTNATTTIDVIAGTQYSIQLTVPDNGDTPADIGGIYELYVKTNQTQTSWAFVTNLVRNTGADGLLELDNGAGLPSGDLPAIVYSDNLASQTTQLKLVSPVSQQSATAKFIVNVESGPNPTGAFYSDSAMTTTITELDEGDSLYFQGVVSNMTDSTQYYAFFTVTNYAGIAMTTNLFASADFIICPDTDNDTTAGLAVNRSGTIGTFSVPSSFAILDGSDKYLEFTVVLCTSAKYDPSKVVYRGSTPTRLMVNNIAPDVSGQRLQMFNITGTTTNTFGYAENTAAFSATLPTDTKRFFRFDASRLANLDVALDLNNAKTTWTVIPPADSNLDSFYEDPVTYVGNPADAVLALTNDVAFAASGRWAITATVTDKDGATSETFTAYVNVIDENARNLYVDFDISTEGIQPTRYLNEPIGAAVDSGNELLFRVGLQYWDAAFTGAITARVDVVSNFTPEAGATNNIPQLRASNGVIIGEALTAASNSYFIVFTRANTNRTLQVVRDSIDGTAESYSDGYQVRASIVSSFVLPTGGQAANVFYYPAEDAALYLINTAPVPEMPEENAVSNAWNVAGGSANSITWRVSDAKLDFTTPWTDNGNTVTGLHVRIEGNNLINGTNIYITANSTSASGVFQPDFGSNQGTGTVSFYFYDKDGASGTSYTYYYYVRPSKFLTTANVGPGEGNEATGISSIYAAADGIGAGHLWVQDADYTRSEYWIMEWNCNTLEKPWVYAYPYAAGAVDNGTLDGGNDKAIDTNGSGTAGKAVTNPYTNPDGALDSFFYGWILPSTVSDDGSATYSLTVSPKYSEKLTRTQVQLPTKELEDGTGYAATHMEAIFAKEWRAADNMGDINADGIPDFFALSKSSYSAGILQTADGTGVELASIATLNDDTASSEERAAGDYLASSGAPSGWADAGQPFTAFLELRGRHVGLNYGMFKADKKEMQDGWVSDVELSYEEKYYLRSAAIAAVDNVKWGGAAAEAAAVTNDLTDVYGDDLFTWLEPVASSDVTAYAKYTNSQKRVKAFINKTWAGYSSGDGADKWGFTVENRTDPTLADTDGDGMDDGYEYAVWYSATVGSTNKDGVVVYATGKKFNRADIETPTDITSADIAAAYNPSEWKDWTKQDTDNDGLYDKEEYLIGTNPYHCDVDGDGLTDYYEVIYNIDPFSTNNPEVNGALMNLDGDFMARGYMEGFYHIFEDETDGTLWAIEIDDVTFEDDGTDTYVGGGRFQVAKFNDGYIPATEYVTNPMLKRTKRITYAGVTGTYTVATDLAVATYVIIDLYHHQVYNYFEFDPRTGWYIDGGNDTLSKTKRWLQDGSPIPGGTPENTAAFTAYDEFLLYKYRTIVGLPIRTQPNMVDADYILLNSTNPNAAFEEKVWGDYDEKPYVQAQHGADTDGDGVPDGWELYVGVDPMISFTIPKSSSGHDPLYWDGDVYHVNTMPTSASGYQATPTRWALAPSETKMYDDGLTLVGEYAGTDTTLAYEACNTVYTNFPAIEGSVHYRWFNKFFPTDPRETDTDRDGISDSEEGADWKEVFRYNRWGQRIATSEIEEREITHNFIYGEPSDAGGNCIRGGGLNPCTIDTDGDGLPDPWEQQYAGIVFQNGKVVESMFGSAPDEELFDDIRAALAAFGDSTNTTEAGYYILCGQDGTFGDAISEVELGKPDLDWDGDGLQNWQEYLVQAMRHFRYDDFHTPLMGFDGPQYDIDTESYTNITWHGQDSNGNGRFLELSYSKRLEDEELETVKELGYTNFVNFVRDYEDFNSEWDYMRDLGYFADPPMDWDHAKLDLEMKYMLPPKNIREKHTYITRPETHNGLITGVPKWTWVGVDYDPTDVNTYFYGTVKVDVGSFDDGEETWYWDDNPLSPYFGNLVTNVYTNVVSKLWSRGSAFGYVGTDPRLWDTDRDGMDDYWELFHGLNPILGDPGVLTERTYTTNGVEVVETYPSNAKDIIYSRYGTISTYDNGWVGFGREWKDGETPPYDAIKYPWMMGTSLCDADGDGLRNEEEAIVANMTSPGTYHTDPSSLWMTDSTVASEEYPVIVTKKVSTNLVTSLGTPVINPLTGLPFTITKTIVTTNSYLTLKSSPSYTALYYNIDKKTVSPFSSSIIAPYEIHEGFDTDGDFRSDADEMHKVVETTSDPLNFDDISRRQSIHFGGDADKGIALTLEPVMRNGNAYDIFRQFTVEAWVRPENPISGKRQFVVTRAANYPNWDLINSNSMVRLNFALGIDTNGYSLARFESSTGEGWVEITGTSLASNKWIHLAMTFDGTTLKLYENAVKVASLDTAMIPANGVYNIRQDPQYTEDFPLSVYTALPSATAIGGSPRGGAFDVSVAAGATWDELAGDFFKGSVDEVRIWDGARSATQIESNYKKRFTVDEIKTNRQTVFNQWKLDYTRNNNDGSQALDPELIQHYNFTTMPGATATNYVQKVPAGFATNVLELVRNPTDDSRMDNLLKVGWWNRIVTNANIAANQVYNSPHVVPWIQNTVTHLPRLSGRVLDSIYWSENYAGYTPASFQGLSKFTFPNAMNPYNLYTSKSNDEVYNHNKYLKRDSDTYRAVRHEEYTEFSGTSDLLPLGSAYAMRLTESWDGEGPEDAWAITTSGNGELDGDPNQNGMPQWAINNGLTAEVYGFQLSSGLLPSGTDPQYASILDINENGIPDWWEKFFGVEDCDPDGDEDQDGLTNYDEYLISFGPDPYGYYRQNPKLMDYPFDPRKFHSGPDKASDYFAAGRPTATKGKYYIGELVTDHDMIENWWESKYHNDYSSVGVYDSADDRDGDGWSNFSEARASMWTGGYLASVVDRYLGGNDYSHEGSSPKPAIGLRVTYNGKQDVTGTPLIMRTYSGKSSRVDATFKARNYVTVSEDSVDNVTRVQILGTYAGPTTFRGHLHPGRIIPGSQVYFEHRALDAEPVYYWHCTTCAGNIWSLAESAYGNPIYNWSNVRVVTGDFYGTYLQYSAHSALHSGAVTLMRTVESFTPFARTSSDSNGQFGEIVTVGASNTTANVVGSFNFQTGEYELDLAKVVDSGWDLTASRIRASYTYHIGDEWPQELWMSDPETGRVKEGLNMIEVFFDLDNNDVWDAGEPFGVVKNVNVGWAQTSLIDVEVTDVSPVVPRIAVTTGASDRFAIKGTGGMVVLTASENEEDNNEEEETVSGVTETYRIVRTKVNTTDMPSRAVVFSKTYVLDDRAYLHEGDVYTDKSFGLDWNTLSAAVHRVGIKMEEISSVTYALEKVSQNSDGSSETEEILTFANTFGSQRAIASAAERIQDGIYKSSSPTFYWTTSDETMTAFKLQVFDASTNEVYNSGIRKLPASQLGVYSFTPDDLHIDFAATNGAPVFADGTNYTWRVALLNPKFNSISNNKDAEGWSTPAAFKMQVESTDGTVTGYGEAYATVRYFGPTNVAANAIIVAAYSTPDFTGAPLAMTRVADVSMLADRTNLFESVSTNAVLKGIEPGNVYLMAFIDRNNNGKRDRYESWGYANKIDSATDFIYSPNPLSVSATGKTGSVVIYIEDTDINKNGILDVEEDLALLDAASSESIDPAVIASDNDLDGLVDTDEVELYGTDATQWDTDGDGMPDGWEQIFSGTDPLNADGDYAVYGDVMAYAETSVTIVVTTNGTQYAEIDTETYYTTFDYNGTLALGAKTAAPAENEIASRRLEKVIVVHGAVFDLLGYDSTTANMKALTLDDTGSNVVYGVNTKPFTALDKYLVVRYFETFGQADEIAMNTNGTWSASTLKPGYYDSGSWSIAGLLNGTAGSGIANGIPDGWELYARFADEADPTKSDEESKTDYDNDNNPVGDSTYLEGDVMAYVAFETPIYTVSDGTNTAKIASLDVEHIVGDTLNANNVYWSVYKYTTGIYGAGTTNVTAALSDWRVVAIDDESSLAFVHAQVYDLYGFNPNTANPNATEPVNTKVFTTRDKVLVKRYMEAIGITDWTNCTLSAYTVDSNLDGIPDGWELYTMFGTNGVASASGTKDNLAISPWITPDAARIVLTNVIADAKLTLVEEYDGGHYPTDPWDTATFGLSDKLTHDYILKGSDGLLDKDNDGLSNYAEYLLTEVFKVAQFSPTNAYSVATNHVDYFYRVGQLYVGEVFTDHDMMADTWEDEQGRAYVDRLFWDAKSDNDEDGWSAFAEARYGEFTSAIVAKNVSHMFNGVELYDVPVPTIRFTARYNGAQSLTGSSSSTNGATLIVQAFTSDMTSADATWLVTPGGTVAKTKNLGLWSDRIVSGTLTPGNVLAGSLKLSFMGYNANDTYLWYLYTSDLSSYTPYTGTYAQYMAALGAYYAYGTTYYVLDDNGDYTPQYGRVQLINPPTEWMKFEGDSTIAVSSDSTTENGYILFNGGRVGTINLATGDYTLDLGKFAQQGLGSRTNANDSLIIENSLVKIDYSASVPTLQGRKLSVSLGEPDTGAVREGKTRFVAFYDLDGNGAYTLGEPYGMIDGADVGWYKSDVTLELTDKSLTGSRIDLAQDLSDSSYVVSNVTQKTSAGVPVYKTTTAQLGSDKVRVRVVRHSWTQGTSWVSMVGNANLVTTIYDEIIDPSVKTTITESDIMGPDDYDIDWTKRSTEIGNTYASTSGSPLAMAYMIIIGDGAAYYPSSSTSSTTTLSALNSVIVREFDPAWQKPVIQTPTLLQMQNSRPTFKWSMTNDTYTAYILEVADSKSNTVWSSGIQHVPARDSNGFYSVEPDVYAGDILKVGTNYNWRVSMYNTKFYTNRTGVAWSDYTPFMVNTQTNGLDYGTIDVCARYFGPDAVRTNGIIRVEAFDTPDFTGKPAARTSLTLADNTAAGDTNTARKVNASLIGLKPGTYYIRGYVDAITYKDGTKNVTNGVDRVLDSWEPWGYVANRGGTSKEVFRPLAVTISSSLGTCELFDLYIEDVDANGNGVPDAYEVQKNKGELYSNASISLNTYGLAVNSALTDSKLNTGSGTAAKLGTKGLLLSSSASGASTSATSLSSALAITLGNSDVAMLLLDTYSPSVTNKAEVTSIDISNISVVTTNTTPMVVIKSSETGTYSYTSASGSPSPFYAPAGDPGSMDVTVYLKYKNSLTDPSWTTAAELTVTVSEDSAVVTGVGPVTPPATVNYDSTTGETTVTITGGDASKCFYMITTEE